MTAPAQVTLSEPPSDGISHVIFDTESDNLLASSWDSTLRLYDGRQNVPRSVYRNKAAVLDCCFLDSSQAICGGLEKVVKVIDFNDGSETVLGAHAEPVRCVNYSRDTRLLFTGSWDSRVSCWDPRAPAPLQQSLHVGNKVFAMALSTTRVVVATANRQVLIYDMRNLSEPEQKRESSLKYQTRAIAAFPDGQGYAVSSIEGRVAIEYFDLSPQVQAQRYAFKCHRIGEKIYPVNALTFHPVHGTFASGGCDGVVNVWDGLNKKRLCQMAGFPSSIASLSFSRDGSLLAVASSYTFEEGEKEHPQDQIFIRPINDSDVRRKSKK